MDTTIKIPLSTLVTIRGQPHHQLVDIHITPHTRNLLGRNYHQLLTDPNISALDSLTPPLRYNPARGLHGKFTEKTAWSMTLSLNQDVLTSYEAQLGTMAEEEARNSRAQLTTNTDNPQTHTNKQPKQLAARHLQAQLQTHVEPQEMAQTTPPCMANIQQPQ